MLLVHRITNHRHDPIGLQAGVNTIYKNMYSVGVHYRYCSVGLQIGMPQ